MRLLSCITDKRELPVFRKLGVNEVYFAVDDIPNYASVGAIGTAAGAREIVRAAHALRLKVFLAANGREAKPEGFAKETLVKRLKLVAAAGVDALIVSSPGLFYTLREEKLGVPLHLSSVQPCFNTAALRFFLRFGVKRLILPSQLAPREASALFALCRSEGLETEIFDYRFFGCVYVNGRCNLHFPRFHTVKRDFNGGSLCRLSGGAPLKVTPVDLRPGAEEQVKASARRVALRMGCGGAPRFYNAATFYDLFAMGAGWLKYGTRLDPTAEKVRKVRAMKAMSGLAEELTAKYGAAEARPRFIEKMTKWELR